MFGFLHSSLVGSGEKLGTDPRIGQSACCGLCQEPFFSGAVTLTNSVGGSWKVATYGGRSQEVYAGRTWTGVGGVRVMLVGFSPAGCTSIRLVVTLEYE
jgi:hypothetical protein